MTQTTLPPSAVALVPVDQADLTRPIRTSDDLLAAFLVGYGESTRRAYARDLRNWGAWLATIGLGPLDAHRAHVETWCRVMEKAGLAPATIARRLAAISGFYDYAVDEDLIARSPLRRIRRPKSPDESPRLGVDRDEIRALLAVAETAGDRAHALVALLVFNGVRISEALGADVTDLGSERGHRTIALRRKGGKRQTVALAPRTAEAIDRLVGDREDGPIFVTRSGRRLDRHAARKTVRRLAGRAGIEHAVSPHSLRHGFVTAALDAGVPLHVVQDGAGHADPRTTRRYDRKRNSLDKAATYAVAAYVAA